MSIKIPIELLGEARSRLHVLGPLRNAPLIADIDRCLVVEAARGDVDYRDLYEKEKRRSQMWIAKYEALSGPEPKVYPASSLA